MSAKTPTNHEQSGNTTDSRLWPGETDDCKKRGHRGVYLTAFLKSVISAAMVSLMIFLFHACSSKSDGGGSPTGPPTGPTVAEQIRAYLTGINPVDLDVQATVENAPTDDPAETKTRMVPGFGEKVCTITPYNLSSNLEDIAILRPTQGIVWPGALVKGDRALLNGVPTPISLDRSSITLSVDLPGFTGGNGTVEIANPANASVQDGINQSLEWWNANAFQEGYVNAAASFFKSDVSYTQDQSSLSLGLGGKNAVGAQASAAFDQSTDETETVLTALYKQTFYTVTVNTPNSPETMFSPSVTLSQVQGQISSESPGAYISSVAYGKIILVRMKTTSTEDTKTLKAALNWAGKKGVSFDADAEATFKKIFKETSIELFAIGGNAETAAELVNIGAKSGALADAIVGKNALYTRDNPGVPIAYTVRYLKDNAVAKLGYTTKYNVIECRVAEDIVKVTFESVKLISDCNFEPGRFTWDFSVKTLLDADSVSLGSAKNVFFDDFCLFCDGSKTVTYNVSRRLNLQRLVDNFFVVKFTISEKTSKANWEGEYQHRWPGWNESPTNGDPFIKLFEDANFLAPCEAEMRYTVKKL